MNETRRRPTSWRDSLGTVRGDPRWRWLGLTVGVIIGITIAVGHWVGFIVAGLAIGIVSPSLRWALASATGVGLLIDLVFLGSLWWDGFLWAAIAMDVFLPVAVAIPIGLIWLGAAVRTVG